MQQSAGLIEKISLFLAKRNEIFRNFSVLYFCRFLINCDSKKPEIISQKNQNVMTAMPRGVSKFPSVVH